MVMIENQLQHKRFGYPDKKFALQGAVIRMYTCMQLAFKNSHTLKMVSVVSVKNTNMQHFPYF